MLQGTGKKHKNQLVEPIELTAAIEADVAAVSQNIKARGVMLTVSYQTKNRISSVDRNKKRKSSQSITWKVR